MMRDLFDMAGGRQSEGEIIVDLFAGGGGASEGIRMALGRDPEAAVNHNPKAVAMHAANHPNTEHFTEDVWNVSPSWITRGRPVGLLWASPDCTHFSKAKGGAPIRNDRIRSLAMVLVDKWIPEVHPPVIIMENVEEMTTWGPLDHTGRVIEAAKGDTFRMFINRLRRQGYSVQYRELRACDYGAPTIRKRLFLIARCDDKPIVWPEPTHGDPNSEAVKSGKLLPWRTAAECIDWSIPAPSIFDTSEEIKAKYGVNAKRPLAEKTMKRIAEGVRRYVLEAEKPFVVNLRAPLEQPAPTVTTIDHNAVVAAHIDRTFGMSKGNAVSAPLGCTTADGGGHSALVASSMALYCGQSVAQDMGEPARTVTSKERHGLVASSLVKMRGTNVGQPTDEPLATVSTGETHHAEVRAFLMKYYSEGGQDQAASDPMHTLTTKARMSLVTVAGQEYIISDIGMRMLQPRELYRAQGFPDSYIIGDDPAQGLTMTKTDQVRMCGNSVCPPMAAALAGANVQELAIQAVEVAG